MGIWHRYVEAIKGPYKHPDRLLCVIGIHATPTIIREGYNQLGQSYEPNHEPRWIYEACGRCGHLTEVYRHHG